MDHFEALLATALEVERGRPEGISCNLHQLV
jgi:hypothetical protein